ncbi:(deoxy)nucleoside triphosphate pyrophosphohydrolase [Paucibacter sp. O1-1]|nr:(deoxy)nucleoside triphosphate pyrophosphohydrolase [Paucibacter sp. O1-1]MDA3830032.1 (deoxy)nucleoside triphosphate pyrophosphohydrolase [Paucibacter sp. O1-1]
MKKTSLNNNKSFYVKQNTCRRWHRDKYPKTNPTCQTSRTLHQGGKWEFPGGKVEANESVSDALIRELKEEVNLDVSSTTEFMDISHDYPDKHVRLDIHLVTDFSGNALGMEGQQVKWVEVQSLSEYEFPEANKPIVEKLFDLDL